MSGQLSARDRGKEARDVATADACLTDHGRHARDLRVGFGGVIAVIQTDTNQLPGFGNGREKLDFIERVSAAACGKFFGFSPAIVAGLNEIQERSKSGGGKIADCLAR